MPEAALGRLRWQRLRQFKGRAWAQDPSIPWQAALTTPVRGTPFVAVLKAWRRRLQRERLRGRRYQPSFRRRQIAITSLGALSALALLGLVTLWSGQLLIAAPLGASCVLLFGYPRSPLAQPRNLVLGNGLGALVGLLLLALGLRGPFALALAVAFTIVLGQQLRCLHPPAGGMAFLVVYLGVGWGFLLFPVLTGSLALVLLAWAFSSWVPGTLTYPQHWL